jgi:threonine efflux protein
MLMLFLTVALVHIVALMSPGPDFFFVSQTAVSRSRKEAMMGVLGITTGVMVWAGVALLGLNLILEKWPGCTVSLWSAAACTCAGWVTRCCVVR